MYRIGSGIDFHQFVEARPFILGGVTIPHTKGLLGHSDADVLLHAIADSLLGALSLGDIGTHFPDTNPKYKNIDSKILLKHCYQLVVDKGFKVINLDCTICLEKPKIMQYIPNMQQIIATLLNINETDVSIKATTTEKMGFIGREEGICALSTILLKQINGYNEN